MGRANFLYFYFVIVLIGNKNFFISCLLKGEKILMFYGSATVRAR